MKPNHLRFSKGDIDESLQIMLEAAVWLEENDKKMWFSEEITREKITNPEDDFIVLWADDISIATMLLSYEDSFFWPGVAGDSAFIHKLAVKREYAGMGYADKMIEYAIEDCRQKDLSYLRLDCDPKRKGLCEFYQRNGFKLTEIKHFSLTKYGEILCAMYEMNIKTEQYSVNK